MRSLVVIAVMVSQLGFGQTWEVKNHPNNRRKAIVSDSVQISDYVYSEVSDLSEGKAYVAQGELYAYISSNGEELTPYVFAIASNFTNGYAIVGDSLSQSVLNDKMQLIVPFTFSRAKLPVHGIIAVQTHDGAWGAYDINGKEVLPFVYDLAPNILSREKIIVRLNEEYGVVNDCNEVIFNYSYQYISASGMGYRSGKYLRLF